jgi:hypothetical protein
MSLKRKTGVYCECGIKCNEVQPGVWECPRCQKVVVRGEFQTAPEKTHPGRVYPKPEDVRGVSFPDSVNQQMAAEDTLQEHIQETVKKSPSYKSLVAAFCVQCGYRIEDGCGVVCPRCKFINPCKTE